MVKAVYDLMFSIILVFAAVLMSIPNVLADFDKHFALENLISAAKAEGFGWTVSDLRHWGKLIKDDWLMRNAPGEVAAGLQPICIMQVGYRYYKYTNKHMVYIYIYNQR